MDGLDRDWISGNIADAYMSMDNGTLASHLLYSRKRQSLSYLAILKLCIPDRPSPLNTAIPYK